MNEEIRLIEDFLNTEVKDYSVDVIKGKALPSVIDGFKPSARKVVFTANLVAKQPKKTAAFVGDVLSKGGYEKGDGAIPGIIAGITQKFPGANNTPYLEGIGEFGSRKIPSGTAAPRYTKIQLHSNFHKYFKDEELHEFTKIQDDAHYEPICFLPVLPTILLNPMVGIAVGFACQYQPYHPKDIIKNIKRVLDGEKQKEMTPYFEGHIGKVHKIEDQWVIDGCISRKGTKIYITEIPVGISREIYVKYLEKLIEKNKIRDYSEAPGDNFDFTITISREMSRKFDDMSDIQILEMFKLRSNLNENLNAISEKDTLLQFNNVNEIIKYFTKYRLTVLTKRKKYMVKKYEDQNTKLRDKVLFINDVLQGKLSLTNLKDKADLISRISKNIKIKNPENVAGMVMYNVTKDELNKAINHIKENKIEIDYFTKVTERTLFENDLKGL